MPTRAIAAFTASDRRLRALGSARLTQVHQRRSAQGPDYWNWLQVAATGPIDRAVVLGPGWSLRPAGATAGLAEDPCRAAGPSPPAPPARPSAQTTSGRLHGQSVPDPTVL